MFNKARVTLTVWFSLAVMMVSLVFSLFIYKSISVEFERGFRRVVMIQEAERQNVKVPLKLPPRFEQIHPQIYNANLSDDMVENLNLVRRRFIGWLALINSIIFVLSLILGYVIAGKSLSPLRRAHESQSRFVADASHEFKTPLSVMKTSIEVLKRKKITSKEDWRDLADSMLTEVNAMQKLTDNLLALTGVGQLDGGFSQINLKENVASAVDRIRPLADKKKIKIILALQNTSIYGQAKNLEQLWVILLDNAIKYSKDGGEVKIEIKLMGNKVRVEIADNGIGIKKSDLGKIFDRFYRSDISRSKSNVGGFGLGLSIARQIVEQNGGDISVKSKLGEGTTFFVVFPVS